MTAAAGLAIMAGWLGGAMLVLSDARRGIAVGLLLAAVGLSLARWGEGDLVEAAILLAGGLLGAVASLRRNHRRGWGLLAAGSTPRIVLCVVLGGAALWLGAGMLERPGKWQARAVVAIVMALGAGRLLSANDPRAALAAASLVALGAGTATALAASEWPGAALGAAAAVFLNLVPTAPDAELGAQRG